MELSYSWRFIDKKKIINIYAKKYALSCHSIKYIYIILLLIIYQLLISRLLGGIIKVKGGYDYQSMLTFLSDTNLSEIWIKVCVDLLKEF